MINASIIAFMGYLSHESRTCHELLENEIDSETGEIFHHMWMGRVADVFCTGGLNEQERGILLDEAERQLAQGHPALSNLIAVSFVENLPPPQEQGFKLIASYPALLKQYSTVFGSW